MPFWSTNFGESSDLKDPKRKFRFTVEFTGINASQGGSFLWYAKTATKPSFAVNAAEHKYLNHTFFYPGAVTWAEVTITLVDPSEPDMTATFADILQASGYRVPTDSTEFTTISKAKAASALGSVIVTQIDAEGGELDKWTLINAFVSDVKFGDGLAYGDDELVELSLTLKYDWATCETANPSVAVGEGTTQGTEFFKV
jgi:hypothetical protein